MLKERTDYDVLEKRATNLLFVTYVESGHLVCIWREFHIDRQRALCQYEYIAGRWQGGAKKRVSTCLGAAEVETKSKGGLFLFELQLLKAKGISQELFLMVL